MLIGVIFTGRGDIGQVEAAVELRQGVFAADQEHGGFGADLVGKGQRLVTARQQFALPGFCNQQSFHGFLLFQDRGLFFEYRNQLLGQFADIPFENQSTALLFREAALRPCPSGLRP